MRRKLSLSDGFPIGGGVLIDGSLLVVDYGPLINDSFLNPCLGGRRAPCWRKSLGRGADRYW
jgi:hypothetical protein